MYTRRLIVNRFQAMGRPTGLTMDYSYVVLDIDVWCPDVVVVVVVVVVCVCGGGGGCKIEITCAEIFL